MNELFDKQIAYIALWLGLSIIIYIVLKRLEKQGKL